MKILIAVDGSKSTRRMLAFIAAHDIWFGCGHDYTVLHCVAAIPHRAAAFAGKQQVRALYEADAEAVLEPVKAFFRMHGVDATFVSRIGAAAPSIAKLADQSKADLIILGTHGRGAVAGVVMGSVTTQVLARTRTPVLLVH